MPIYQWNMLIFLIAIISAILSGRVTAVFNRWDKYPVQSGLTGSQVAKKILESNGIFDVQIGTVNGTLTDHYHPTYKTLNLSSAVANGNSIAALAVAAHECGHAIQHHNQYWLLNIRNAILPLASFGSQAGTYICLIGLLFNGRFLTTLGVVLFVFAVAFQILTLPVEIDASKRALCILKENRYIQDDEVRGARKVLTAAAMTYVIAAIASIASLLRLLAITKDDD